MKKKILTIVTAIISVLLFLILVYFAYAFGTYYRVEDNLNLEVISETESGPVKTAKDYTLVSYNIGFGAYSDDYTFFMDGGHESWAFSKEAVIENVSNAISDISSYKADFTFFQEVDVDATRSYHIDEKDLIINNYTANTPVASYDFAQNFDSPFLMYPLYQPHGKSKAGLLTISNFNIDSAIRRSLPIEEGFTKFFDLDRCYVKNYLPVEGSDKMLVLYNVHLSAYTTDPTTAVNQIVMLNEDMKEEYEKGNYVIAGGDMNKDLLGKSDEYFDRGSVNLDWAKPFPTELLDESFTLIAPLNTEAPVPSCRNANEPYNPRNTVLTVDGFIVSENVAAKESDVIDTGFENSDHNPVYLKFMLKNTMEQ